MTKGEIAEQNFLSGLNCSQSVVLAFKDEIGLDELTLKKLAIGFGGGFGRQRLVCGAVSGMVMALNCLLSDGVDKMKIYAIIQQACNEFKAKVGSVICGELLSGSVPVNTSPIPEERTKEYYEKRPCSELCKIAADVAEKIIKENK